MKEVPYPFIAHVIKDQKYPHYYVITGANKNSVFIADPDPTVKMTKLSKEVFLSEWTGISLFLSPAPSYQPTKDKTSSLSSFIPIIIRQKKVILNKEKVGDMVLQVILGEVGIYHGILWALWVDNYCYQ